MNNETKSIIMDKMVATEQMLIALKDKLFELRQKHRQCLVENQTLALENEELKLQLDGWTKCPACNGDGGHYHGAQVTPKPDPQTFVDCPGCDGEGWVGGRHAG